VRIGPAEGADVLEPASVEVALSVLVPTQADLIAISRERSAALRFNAESWSSTGEEDLRGVEVTEPVEKRELEIVGSPDAAADGLVKVNDESFRGCSKLAEDVFLISP